MMDENRLLDLVEQWDDARRAGAPISVDEVCKSYPELKERLADSIEALTSMDWLQCSGNGVDLIERPLPILPGTNLGRYKLIELIGRGGYGDVWEAFDPQLERLVAIKVPRADRRNQMHSIEQFFEEARKVAKLKHQGIVPVFDVGSDGEWCFMVSDYVAGENLKEFVTKSNLSHKSAAALVADIADSLDYAHSQGFVHRDVKPQNILIDRDGHPHLTDFGIALLDGQSVPERLATAGTLPYMSPEQAEGRMESINSRTDIYALGVVLYELLTGRQPFVANNPMDLWASIISCKPRPPRSHNASIPVELEKVCLKAISKQQEQRYRGAGEMAAELRTAISKMRQDPPWLPWLLITAVLVASFLTSRVVRSFQKSWTGKQQIPGEVAR